MNKAQKMSKQAEGGHGPVKFSELGVKKSACWGKNKL